MLEKMFKKFFNLNFFLLFVFWILIKTSKGSQNGTNFFQRFPRALQVEHEKPAAVKWRETFIDQKFPINEQSLALVKLLKHVAKKHLDGCTVMILYDADILEEDRTFLRELLHDFPLAYVQGTLTKNSVKDRARQLFEASGNNCIGYVLLLGDVMRIREVIGDQNEAKVVVVARNSQWRVHEFLASEVAQTYVNLLVIVASEKSYYKETVVPYILYTHDMYIDGLGSSRPRLLTSWYKTKLSRPYIRLFPKKMTNGFAGHRFIIAVADQAPFTVAKGRDINDDIRWDGVEVRFIKLLAEMLNFTRDFHEAKDANVLGSGNAVIKMVREGRANIGTAGLYVTHDRLEEVDMSHGHSQDCAAFISLTSTALPRYRAILGPFKWTVWAALTLTYLFAIFPITFSDKLTLKHLLRKPEEIENMFWYVFGTFTNAFSFAGRDSWSGSLRTSTRLFIGFYWIFTIIITACYTGSVIAFVTLPVYPATVDTVKQLISGRYQVGTLDKGGWQYWFENSTDPYSEKLLKNIEYVPDVQSGLKNITTAFFWPYAFLGSRDQLNYIVRTNFTTSNKRALFHISTDCFAPFAVSLAFPKNSVYNSVLNAAVLRTYQSGLIKKIRGDFEFEMMRSATGKLLQANSVGSTRVLSAEDRSLTLADTQGMFLLLGAGCAMGGAALLSEWLGGCFNFCRGKGRRVSISTTARTSVVSESPISITSNTGYIHPSPINGKTDKDRQELNGDLIRTNQGQSCEIIIHHPTNENSPENFSNEENDEENFEDASNNAISDDLPKMKKNIHDNEISENEFLENEEKNEDTIVDGEISELDENISELFNFDFLFGEENLNIENKRHLNDVTVDDQIQVTQNGI